MSDFNLQAKGLFGRYCRIEMFRYGVPNEFYIHKIVSQNRQNRYCDVPLRWDSKPEIHEAKDGVPFPDYLEEVIWVVQCGIDETKVFPVALKDVELLGEDFNEGCEFQKVGSDGYPFCASSTEIMRLRGVLESYAKAFEGWAGENDGSGRQMDGPDWLELANELRMERDGV